MWLRKADLLTGLAVALFGAAALVGALTFRWDLASVRQAGWYTAPGILPAGVAIVLIVQGLALSAHAYRSGARWARADLVRLRVGLAAPRARRVGLAVLLLILYVFGMVGRIQFTVASFAFLTVFMHIFGVRPPWKVAVVAAAASSAISYAFNGVAGVPLP
jgi:hypothetical protein